MSIPILTDVIAPNSLWSAGVSGKQIRKNSRARVQSGEMMINVGWTNTLRQYQFGSVPLTVDQWQSLEGLYEVTDAGASGFLVQDPKDCLVTVAMGKASLISAGAHTYQLFKRYTSVGSSRTKDRTLRHINAASFRLFISGVESFAFTLAANTGVVTIAADPAASNITWSGQYYVPVHFENDEIDWDLAIAGPAETRLMAGPSVVLMEVKE